MGSYPNPDPNPSPLTRCVVGSFVLVSFAPEEQIVNSVEEIWEMVRSGRLTLTLTLALTLSQPQP